MASFSGLDDDFPFYNENGLPVKLDNGNAAIAGAATFDGAILTLARSGGADPNDIFGSTGSLSLSDGQVLLQETDDQSSEPIALAVGTSTSTDGALVIVFNANADQARVNAVLEQLTYGYGGDAPPSTAKIDYSFDDGESGPAAGSVTVFIGQVNDPPTLDNV